MLHGIAIEGAVFTKSDAQVILIILIAFLRRGPGSRGGQGYITGVEAEELQHVLVGRYHIGYIAQILKLRGR
jgi:hypothetical protein